MFFYLLAEIFWEIRHEVQNSDASLSLIAAASACALSWLEEHLDLDRPFRYYSLDYTLLFQLSFLHPKYKHGIHICFQMYS